MGQPQTPKLLRYIDDLRAYLEGRNVVLIDLAQDTPLTEAHFADGSHLDREIGRPLFTRLVAEARREELDLER
jgi:hypothetical protein